MAKKEEGKTHAELMNEIRQKSHRVQGDLNYLLEVFGDGIGKKQGWKNDLQGFEAIRYYLMTKHHWTPAQVQSMSLADLRFALTEEMTGWTVPKARKQPAGR